MNYSYRCPGCGIFTLEQSMKDDPISECPACGQPIKRIIGKNVMVIYRGSGFYSTDKGGSSCPSSCAADHCTSCGHHESA